MGTSTSRSSDFGNQTPIGFDYGTRARVVVVGDIDFDDLLRRGLIGLTYEMKASAGLLADVPALILLFQDAETAHGCFDLFRQWIQAFGTCEALVIRFTHHTDGELTFSVSENTRLLLETVAPPPAVKSEIETEAVLAVYSMSFREQSSGYQAFTTAASRSPFLVVPATLAHGPMWDLAVHKSQFELAFDCENKSASSVAQPVRRAGRWRIEDSEITPRRRTQLRRFYPVTFEQLRHDQSAKHLSDELSNRGYRHWQVEQALCNLRLINRLTAEGYRLPRHAAELITAAAQTHERADLFTQPLTTDIGVVEAQVEADARQLIDYVVDNRLDEQVNAQEFLSSRGLLDG